MINFTKPNTFPEMPLEAEELTDEELEPTFFAPDFLRPLPVPECMGSQEEDDFEDAYWLIPGIVPEPYWDINMGMEFNFAQLKFYMKKALRMPLV